LLKQQGKEGKVAGRGENLGGAGPGEAEEGGKKGRGGEETDRWDPVVSERKRKEKGGGGVGWRGEWLVGRWAARPERRGGKFLFFLFFFKPFSNILLNSNSNQISFKLFTKFYNLFKSHTSNQKPCKAK
jgi:hypothetical protein